MCSVYTHLLLLQFSIGLEQFTQNTIHYKELQTNKNNMELNFLTVVATCLRFFDMQWNQTKCQKVWTDHKINNWYICKTCKLTNSFIKISFLYLEQSIYTLSMCLDKVIIIIIHIFGPNLTTSNTCLYHTWFRQIDLLEISPFQIFT